MAGPGWYLIGEEELAEVVDVIRRRELTRYRFDDSDETEPSKVYQFERTFAEIIGTKYCLALNSGTSSLLAGLASLGIGPGDEVIVPGYTFIASMAAIAHVRALPVLAEIDYTLTLDPCDVQKKITSRTKAIMAVHMLGFPANLEELHTIAKNNGLFLIEDVAQACGGAYRGKKLGSWGDVGAFSLGHFKVITAGDGGMLTTNNDSAFQRAFAFHDQGFKPYRLGVIDDSSLLGINLRMHELTGAVALAQVRKLQQILNKLRFQKRQFISALPPLIDCRFAPLNDVDGECSTVLAIQFDTVERANSVAFALGTKTLIQSGKHYYGNMVQLLNCNMPSQRGCPFNCPSYPAMEPYRIGMLPRTDNILARTICLSVGVVDSYLGTGFGINILDDQTTVQRKADEFSHVITLNK